MTNCQTCVHWKLTPCLKWGIIWVTDTPTEACKAGYVLCLNGISKNPMNCPGYKKSLWAAFRIKIWGDYQ